MLSKLSRGHLIETMAPEIGGSSFAHLCTLEVLSVRALYRREGWNAG